MIHSVKRILKLSGFYFGSRCYRWNLQVYSGCGSGPSTCLRLIDLWIGALLTLAAAETCGHSCRAWLSSTNKTKCWTSELQPSKNNSPEASCACRSMKTQQRSLVEDRRSMLPALCQALKSLCCSSSHQQEVQTCLAAAVGVRGVRGDICPLCFHTVVTLVWRLTLADGPDHGGLV